MYTVKLWFDNGWWNYEVSAPGSDERSWGNARERETAEYQAAKALALFNGTPVPNAPRVRVVKRDLAQPVLL